MFIIMGVIWFVFVGAPMIAGRVAYLNTLEDELYRKALMSKEWEE